VPRERYEIKLAISIAVAATSAACFAQFSDNFESETGSGAGTLLTNGFGGGGQNGWYNPVSGDVDTNVYTYAGNTLGFAANPDGGSQFLGGVSQGGTSYARAQHDVAFVSSGMWELSFDFAALYSGALPATDNLGSVSLQPSTTANYFQTIYQWTYPNDNSATAAAFSANIGATLLPGGLAGGLTTNGTDFHSPGAAWTNLPLNHWFHQTITWNYASNTIIDTTLQDVTAGGPLNDFQPTGWYLTGGANNALGQPTATAIRYFVGGTTAGNTMAFDNVAVGPVPEPASLAALSLGALALIRRRRNGKR